MTPEEKLGLDALVKRVLSSRDKLIEKQKKLGVQLVHVNNFLMVAQALKAKNDGDPGDDTLDLDMTKLDRREV